MAKNIGVKFAIGATMSTTVASVFATMDSKIKSLKANIKELNTVSARAATLMTADSRPQDTRRQYTANPTEQQAKVLVTAERAYTSAERSAKKYNITTADAAKVHAQATEAIKTTQAALDRQEQFQTNAAKRSTLHGQIFDTIAIVSAPFKLAIDYESAMADVKKVTNFDAPGFKKFNDDLLTLSTRIPLTAEGLAKIAAAAGEAGIAESEMLRFVEDAAKMSVAFGVSADAAGSAMTGLRGNFHLNQEGVILLGDSFNHLANNMDARASEIVDFATRTGRVASQYGMTGQQVGAIGAAMIAMKMPTEVASRATSSLFMKLGTADTASKDTQAAFRRLGFSGKEMAKAFKDDAQGTLLTFLEAVKRSPDPIRELKDIMGEGFADEIAGLVGGIDKYKEALNLVSDPSKYSGSMNEEADTRARTTTNAILLMKNSAQRLGIILGSTVLPGIAAVARGVTSMLEPVSRVAAAFPKVTATVFGVVTALVGLKVAALAGAYAGTLISDGWLIAKGILNALRPSVMANTIAIQRQRIATLYSAAATKVKVAAEKVHAFAVAISNRQTALATLGQIRHRTVTLATAAAQNVLNFAMRANPIGVVVTALTALAGWFYTAYEKAGSFTGALKVMWDQFKAVVPTMEVVEAAVVGLVTFVSDLWNGMSLYDAGANLMSTLWDGVVAMWETVKGYWNTVKGWFGFGDDEEIDIKPVTELTAVAEQSTVARTETLVQAKARAQPSSTARTEFGTSGAQAPQGVARERTHQPAPSGSGTQASVRVAPSGGGAIQVTQQFTFQMNGMPDKEFARRVVEAVKAQKGDLEKVLVEIISNQRRLAYDT